MPSCRFVFCVWYGTRYGTIPYQLLVWYVLLSLAQNFGQRKGLIFLSTLQHTNNPKVHHHGELPASL